MSTTSKLEEAEHKVQSLQTGVMFSLLVQPILGRLKWGALGHPLVPPLPLPHTGHLGGVKEHTLLRAPQSLHLDFTITHTESLTSRWEDLNSFSIPSTSRPFFPLFFQHTRVNRQTVKDCHFIWNSNRKENHKKHNTYFHPKCSSVQ